MSKQCHRNQSGKAKKIVLLVVVVLFTTQAYPQKNIESGERQLNSLSTNNSRGTSASFSTSASAKPVQSKVEGLSTGSGMGFIPNKGQIVDMGGKLRPDVLYKGGGGGADIYLRRHRELRRLWL